MVEFVSANPDRAAARRPRPSRGLRRDAREPARCRRLRRAPRVLHQRRRPADGHPRGQRLAALPRGLRRAVAVSDERLSRRLHASRSPPSWCERAGRTPASTGRRRSSRACRPTRPSGDKDLYIDAVIERAQALLGADGFRAGRSTSRSTDILGGHPRRPRGVRRALRQLVQRARPRRRTARSTTRSSCLRDNGVVYEKDGAQWFRATDFGDEKDRVVVRENGAKTYFASDIAYHLRQARARLRPAGRRAGRRSPRLHRARARGSRRPWASPATASTCG